MLRLGHQARTIAPRGRPYLNRFGKNGRRARNQVSEMSRDAGDAQDARRMAHNPEVEGSNPSPATKARGPFSNRERASCMWFVKRARSEALMTDDLARRGLLDTNIMILRSWIAPEELPDEMAISAVTLAELSAGPHEVRPDTEQDAYFEAAERARRLDVLQRAEHEFDPIPFDADAARAYGRVTAAVIAVGRKPAAVQSTS